ncbi:MAG: UbiX family flavin prenyltransferase [Prevotellaceae bacterium]|jgi:4-hydroxy-3-polyprenylbenzoate decarboxylase|nr:UbiX family flavin prenyltransferase [Prevotellaceae bacterium]
MKHRSIVVGITGASGAIYAKRLLDKLAALPGTDAAVVFTPCGEQVFRHELGDEAFRTLPFKRYDNTDFFAPFASGSSLFDTLIIAPCSMGAVARIAAGLASDLVSRTADVMLKERRTLILVPRETPLNAIHLQNMLRITEAGGIVCPANPSFYSRPPTIEAVVDTVADRVLQLAGFTTASPHWGEG